MEDKLRRWLLGKLQVDDATMELLWGKIWEWDSAYIDRALDGSDVGREDLLSLAKFLLSWGRDFRALDRPGRARDADLSRERESRVRQRETTLLGPVLGALTAYEQQRSFLVSQVLAHNASQEEHVAHFREKVLGRLLSRPEAQAFVTSGANAVFGLDALRAAGVPLVDHEARLEPVEVVHGGLRVAVYVDPPGMTLHRDLDGGIDPRRLRRIRLPPVHSENDVLYVLPNSVLDELALISLELAMRYVWPEPYATEFVLTGILPIVPPIRSWEGETGPPDYPRRVIALEIEPWANADTVLSVYRGLQRQLLGGTNRRLRDKTLAIVAFTLARTDPGEWQPRFRKLARQWNQEYETVRPEWVYRDLDQFGRDFQKAKRALLPPTNLDVQRSAPQTDQDRPPGS